ncbi:hypothetical protein D3C76_1340100 [compost metagenome]
MVELDQVIDHAKPGDIHRCRRNGEHQHEEQRHGVVFPAPGQHQRDDGSRGVDPEAEGEERQQGNQQPQVAPPLEVAIGNQVAGRSTGQEEHHARDKQNDD